MRVTQAHPLGPEKKVTTRGKGRKDLGRKEDRVGEKDGSPEGQQKKMKSGILGKQDVGKSLLNVLQTSEVSRPRDSKGGGT